MTDDETKELQDASDAAIDAEEAAMTRLLDYITTLGNRQLDARFHAYVTASRDAALARLAQVEHSQAVARSMTDDAPRDERKTALDVPRGMTRDMAASDTIIAADGQVIKSKVTS